MSTTPPALDDFHDWVLESHGATFDAMEGATGATYRAHLDSFTRTNAALNLLVQFKAAHPASPGASSADSELPSSLATMTEQRQMVSLEAVWEIDAIARNLPGLADGVEDQTAVRLLVRAMAGRMLRLTGALMSVLNEEDEPTEDLARIVMLHGGQG